MGDNLCHRWQPVSGYLCFLRPNSAYESSLSKSRAQGSLLTQHPPPPYRLGVVTDNLYQTDQNTCQTDDKSDLSVQVKMAGAWGAAGGATSAAVRDALVQTMWASLDALWQPSRYAVYEGCSGLTWQEGPLYAASAACGPSSLAAGTGPSCADACPASVASTPDLVQCERLTWAGRVPSELRVTVYEDGALRADELTVSFAAAANDVGDGGCGLVGVLAEQMAGFIPGVGGLFAAGINYKCN